MWDKGCMVRQKVLTIRATTNLNPMEYQTSDMMVMCKSQSCLVVGQQYHMACKKPTHLVDNHRYNAGSAREGLQEAQEAGEGCGESHFYGDHQQHDRSLHWSHEIKVSN